MLQKNNGQLAVFGKLSASVETVGPLSNPSTSLGAGFLESIFEFDLKKIRDAQQAITREIDE